MEPNTIEESIKGLLEAIKESPEYLEFQKVPIPRPALSGTG